MKIAVSVMILMAGFGVSAQTDPFGFDSTPVAGSKPQTTEQCTAKKWMAIGKNATDDFTCQRVAAAMGTVPSPDCELNADARLNKSYASAEAAGNCPTVGDAPQALQEVDDFVDQVTPLLRPQSNPPQPEPANACAASKLKAVGVKASDKLKCWAKAKVKFLNQPDPKCISKAETKFQNAFTKAEAHPPCLTTGDEGDMESRVDAFVTSIVNPPTTTTTTMPTTTTTSTSTTSSTTSSTTTTTLPDCESAVAPQCGGTCGVGTCQPNGIGSCSCQ